MRPGSAPVFDPRKEALCPCGMSLGACGLGAGRAVSRPQRGWAGAPSESETHLPTEGGLNSWEKEMCPSNCTGSLSQPWLKPVSPMDFLANYDINFPYLLTPFWSVFLIAHRVRVESPSITKIKGPTVATHPAGMTASKAIAYTNQQLRNIMGRKNKTTVGI